MQNSRSGSDQNTVGDFSKYGLTNILAVCIIYLTRQLERQLKPIRFWCNKTKEIASYFTRAGMLFLIFQIQNSYDQKPCIQDNHKFFICTHKPHSFLQDSETEWQRILPVAWVSILYCQCTFWQICQFIIFFYSSHFNSQCLCTDIYFLLFFTNSANWRISSSSSSVYSSPSK